MFRNYYYCPLFTVRSIEVVETETQTEKTHKQHLMIQTQQHPNQRANKPSKGPRHHQFPSMEAKSIFKRTGTLYVLVASQWNKLGKGTLSLIYNPHNARELVFKLKTDNDLHIFQLKPKLKPKGGSSWVLKATVRIIIQNSIHFWCKR